MSTDNPASGVTFDAEPTLPREVQPFSHENPDSSSCQNDFCQPKSSTSEEVAKSRHCLSSSSTEDTTENSDTLQIPLHSTATKQRGSVLRKPPDDWAFNDLLLQIDDYVTSFAPDSLEKFKSLFRGPGPSSYKKKKIQDCRTCMQFFNVLREDLYLSKDNTLYLQKFLHMIGNKELIEKTIKYCKTEGTMYFYKAEEEPEQGTAPVMFHVKGKNLDYFTPEFVREVRDIVAAILCVPHEHILIAGLKPSESFLITLIIPDIYVDILQTMLNNKEELFQLSKKNIDYILINQTKYFTIRHVTVEKPRLSEVDIKVLNDISAELSDEERRTLMEGYQWKDKDIVKACVDAEKKLLLLGLLCKETEKSQIEIPVESVCAQIFKRIQRKDLFETFQHRKKEKLMELRIGNKEALMADVYKYSSEFANKFMHELMEQAEEAEKKLLANPTPRLIPVHKYDTFGYNLD